MTDIYRFSEPQLILFFLVLVRLTAFVVSWPVFGVENVPQQLKILFGLLLAFVLFPTINTAAAPTTAFSGNLVLMVMREAFIGLALGYLARLFFFAFRIGGEMISQSMGLSAGAVFNPMMGGQTTALEQFYVALATLVYLASNGHHMLISGLNSTFQFLPVGQLSLNTSQFLGVGQMVQEIIELGLKFSAPIVVSILVVNIILGVVGKTVPQLNVLVTSFAINIMVGFVLIILTLPMILDQMQEYLQISTEQVFALVKTF